MDGPPATFGVINRNHSNGLSPNLYQNVTKRYDMRTVSENSRC